MCQDRAVTQSTIQVEDRGVVVNCNFPSRIHPADVAVCQPREPSSNTGKQLNEMNGEQGAAEGRTAERGSHLIMLNTSGVKVESSIWDNQK